MSSKDYAIITMCVLLFSAFCTLSWWLQSRHDEELAQCVAEYPQLASVELVDRADHDIRRLCGRLRAAERVEWAQQEKDQ